MRGKTAPAVEATALVKTFTPKNARTVTALRGLDFSVSAGELTALVGPDGAGKTTLLRLIAGLLDNTMSQKSRRRFRAASVTCRRSSVSTKI